MTYHTSLINVQHIIRSTRKTFLHFLFLYLCQFLTFFGIWQGVLDEEYLKISCHETRIKWWVYIERIGHMNQTRKGHKTRRNVMSPTEPFTMECLSGLPQNSKDNLILNHTTIRKFCCLVFSNVTKFNILTKTHFFQYIFLVPYNFNLLEN